MASRGPGVLRLSEEMSGYVSVQPQDRTSTWPLRLDPADMLKLSAAQREAISCSASPCAVTLHSKVACLVRWRHAPLREWADGLCPHSCLPSGACRSAIPARREAGASQTSTGA